MKRLLSSSFIKNYAQHSHPQHFQATKLMFSLLFPLCSICYHPHFPGCHVIINYYCCAVHFEFVSMQGHITIAVWFLVFNLLNVHKTANPTFNTETNTVAIVTNVCCKKVSTMGIVSVHPKSTWIITNSWMWLYIASFHTHVRLWYWFWLSLAHIVRV